MMGTMKEGKVCARPQCWSFNLQLQMFKALPHRVQPKHPPNCQSFIFNMAFFIIMNRDIMLSSNDCFN